jgi:hypothetical protein
MLHHVHDTTGQARFDLPRQPLSTSVCVADLNMQQHTPRKTALRPKTPSSQSRNGE